jgi:hypothetical protein
MALNALALLTVAASSLVTFLYRPSGSTHLITSSHFCYLGLYVAAARLAGRLFPKGRLHAWYRVYEEPCGCTQGRAWPKSSCLSHLKLIGANCTGVL